MEPSVSVASPESARPRRYKTSISSPSERVYRAFSQRPDLLALTVIVALALIVRFFALGTIPANVTADEADNLQVAFHIKTGMGSPGFFGFDWKPAPAFSMYLMTFFLEVFGWTIPSMRLASALLSTLALVPYYLLLRRYLTSAASLVATFLLSTSIWYLNFSRSGWENVQVGLFLVIAAWGLVKALESPSLKRAIPFWIIAGIGSALGLYGYFTGRLIIAALLAFFPFAILVGEGTKRAEADRRNPHSIASARNRALAIILGYAIIVVVSAVLFAPQAEKIVNNWERFNNRTMVVSIFNVELPYRGANTMPEVFFGQIDRMVRGFFLLDGSVINNPRYFPVGRPILDLFSGALYLLGLIAGILAWRRAALWWCLLLVPLVGTQIFSQGTPDLARAIGVAPALFFFVGLGFETIARKRGSVLKPVQLLALLIVPIVGFSNVSGYFNWISRPEVIQARRPAINNEDFFVWMDLQLKEAAQGRWGLTASQWEELQKTLPGPNGQSGQGQAAPPALTPIAISRPVNPPRTDGATFEAAFGDASIFAQPRGVAIGGDGSLYVVDSGTRMVFRLDGAGNVVGSWGGEGSANGQFLTPWDVATDKDGKVYVLDSDAPSIQRFDPAGGFEAKLGDKVGFYKPRGLTIDPNGAFFVTDTGRNRIVKLSPDGAIVQVFGPDSGLKLEQPTDVAVDSVGNIWVAEPAARRLQVLSAAGASLVQYEISGSDTQDAPHLAADGEMVLMTDPHLGQVFVFTLDGGAISSFGAIGAAEGQLNSPVGIATCSGCKVFVADLKNFRVQRFALK